MTAEEITALYLSRPPVPESDGDERAALLLAAIHRTTTK